MAVFSLGVVLVLVHLAILLSIFVVLLVLFYLTKRPSGAKYEGRHALITGGSQGIGLELAKQCAARGSDVTILARNTIQLNIAKTEIEKCRMYPDSQRVQVISCDLASNYENVENAIRSAEEAFDKHVEILINSAGFSQNKYFEDFTIPQFKMLMDVNYFGALYATKAVLEKMKLAKSGTIAFLSSQGGQIGFIGMSAYGPTKYALKGLAECLRNELLPFNINVGVVYPPDTDTPGYANENLDKAVECREISETVDIMKPDYVAKIILTELGRGTFSISIGLDGFMLDAVTCGMSPSDSILKSFIQVTLLGVFRLIGMFYSTVFQGIVMKHKEKRYLYK